jgi:large subunit ribosomal protein L21
LPALAEPHSKAPYTFVTSCRADTATFSVRMVVTTVYAVVRSGGKQYRVEEGALLTVATLEGEPGKEVTFGDVLLLADGDTVKDAAGAKVTGEIVGHGKGEKIVVFRYKNKTRSRKRTGHRTKTTTIRITKIEA